MQHTNISPSNRVGQKFPFRFVIYALAAFGSTACGALYSSVHFAWVCMVNGTANPSGLDWGNNEQQVIFAGYSVGALASLFIGWALNRFGARLVYPLSVTVAAIASFMIPTAAYRGKLALVAILRIFVGFGACVFFSAGFQVSSVWAPRSESGITFALATCGMLLGQVFGMLLAGLICENIGWEWIFYLDGIFALIFCAVWIPVYRNSPQKHPLMTASELAIIEHGKTEKRSKRTKIDWSGILRNVPVWSCLIVRFLKVFCLFATDQFSPTILRYHLKLSPAVNGYASAGILLGAVIGRFLGGYLSDLKCGSPETRVKTVNVISTLGNAGCCLAITFLGPEQAVGIVSLLAGNLFFHLLDTGGYMMAPIYLAPQYSDVVGSMVFAAGAVATAIMPFVIDSITHNQTREEWNVVFYLLVALPLAATLIFLIFGSAKLQPFAKANVESSTADQKQKYVPAACVTGL